MMTIEQMTLASLLLNTLVVPVLIGVARWLWRTERRLLRIEMRLGLAEKG